MNYLNFDQPIIVDIKKNPKPSDCDISIKDLKKDQIPKNLKSDFTISKEFSQRAYRDAIRNKLLIANKPYILRFFLHHFDLQDDPLKWLDAVDRTIRYEEPDISAKYIESSNLDTFIEVKEVIELIINEPRYHFEKLKINKSKNIRLKFSRPEISLLNQLLVRTKVFEEDDLHLLESVLSNNFASKESQGNIIKSQLMNNRYSYKEKNIDSIEEFINDLKYFLKDIKNNLHS